ncbi:MAG: DUF4175 family protein, partial [Pacificimonas sp.]
QALETATEAAAAAGMPGGEALGAAGAAMADAETALQAGETARAARAQSRALDSLAEAAESAQQAAAQAQQAASGRMQPGSSGGGLDPLGRPGRDFGLGDVQLPDERRVRRVEELRALIEERAADPQRSERERAYYLRLLKRF